MGGDELVTMPSCLGIPWSASYGPVVRVSQGSQSATRSGIRSTTPVREKSSTGTGVPQSSRGRPVLASSAQRKKAGDVM